MSECSEWLKELTFEKDRILNDDLQGIKRKAEQPRIETYNEIVENENELEREFFKECRDFLTSEELKHERGEFRLARLLIAASFYTEDRPMPETMQDEFLDVELDAVVNFEKYSQFDNADEEEIEYQINNMEGEIYELVQEYMVSQNTDLMDLYNNPQVQDDITDRLADRYHDRFENIEHGVFSFIQSHGLPDTVESIEEAVKEVSDASAEREKVRNMLEEELQNLETSLEQGFRQQRKDIERELTHVERQIASETIDGDAIRRELQAIDTIDESVIDELNTSINRTRELEESMEEKIAELESIKEEAANEEDESVGEKTAAVVEEELARLQEQRSELQTEIEGLQLEREQIEEARTRLDEKQESLEERVEDVESSVETEAGIEGTDVVTSTTARLFEMDYIGRFDTTMYEIDSIRMPDKDFTVPTDYWDGRSDPRSERARMSRLLDENDGGSVETSPINRTSRYEITDSKYLGLSETTEMVIEATVFSHLEGHAINGFDAAPANLEDLLSFVNAAVKEASETEVPYLLGIASPTGWTDRVIESVKNDEISRTRYSRHVSVCLIDLRSGELYYDDSDPIVADNIGIFERSVYAESVDQCVQDIRSEYVADLGRETVFAEEIVDEFDYDEHEVKQAFDRLESKGDGAQFYVDDEGLAIDVS